MEQLRKKWSGHCLMSGRRPPQKPDVGKYRWPRKHPFNSDFPVGNTEGSDGEDYLGTAAASKGSKEQGRLSLARAR